MEEESYMHQSADHAANLNNMRLSGEFCDVVIKGKNKEFPAHKVILAANLKYFKLIFSNLNEETKQSGFVSMDDFDETYLEAFISFAYSGQILLSESNVLGLFQMAIDLQADELITTCTQFLADHLKVENACSIYTIANAREYLPLKDAAICIISRHFEDCSQTQDFLDLDYDSMKHILSEIIFSFHTSRQMLFEGLIRWIQHDVNSRQNCVKDLFNIIDLDKLNRDYLLEYASKNVENHGFIVKNVLSCYHKKIEQRSGESLMLIGNIGKTLYVQVWNFWPPWDRKWSTPHKIIQPEGCNMTPESGAVFDKTFYNLVIDCSSQENVNVHIAEFNISTMQNRVLLCDSRLIRDSAVCASTRFIYLCGGRTNEGLISDQILRYNPKTNVLRTLRSMTTKRCNATAIFCQGCLYVLGGRDESMEFIDLVERYDPTTKVWSSLQAMNSIFCEGSGITVLDDELYIGGGLRITKRSKKTSKKTVAVYDPETDRVKSIRTMRKKRRRFHMVGYEGKLLAVGDNRVAEVYDPILNQWEEDYRLSSGLQIRYIAGGLIACDQSKSVEVSEDVENECKRRKLDD